MTKVIVNVDSSVHVSGLLCVPTSAKACYVCAHGAGAGMAHPFLEEISSELAQRGIATLRFQFPYMEHGGKRPDPPSVAHSTIRSAVAEACRLVPNLPLIAGGRSFGGRMSSQAQAASPLPNVKGLAFLGFPLHPAGRPSDDRARHLFDVHVPMLFLQGTRDALADLTLLEPLMRRLGGRSTLKPVNDADHSFHVAARTGRKDPQVKREIAEALDDWISNVIRTTNITGSS